MHSTSSSDDDAERQSLLQHRRHRKQQQQQQQQQQHDHTTQSNAPTNQPHSSDSLPWHHPQRAWFRWFGLLVVSFITFGTAMAYDSVGALGPVFKSTLHIDAEGLADLYAAYHVPNLVLVFFGGILSDRIGTRKAVVLFSSIVFLGVLLVACSHSLRWMLLGRFLFGCGSETLSVVQLGILSHWYSQSSMPPSIGLACAIALMVTRMGTMMAFDILPIIADTSAGLHGALWFVVLVCVGSFMLSLVYLRMDSHRSAALRLDASSHRADAADEPDSSKSYDVVTGTSADEQEGGGADDSADLMPSFQQMSSQVSGIPVAYWHVVVVCLCHYSVLISFSDFSADFFHEEWGYSAQKASRIQSATTMIGIVLTPLAGAAADAFGYRARLMLAGSLLLLPAHFIVSFMHVYPLYSCVLQGIASALVASSLWPSVALIMSDKHVNTAVGLMTALQNTALFCVPQIVGFLRTHSGSYQRGIFFYICLDFGAILSCLWLINSSHPSATVLSLSARELKERRDEPIDEHDADCVDPLLKAA